MIKFQTANETVKYYSYTIRITLSNSKNTEFEEIEVYLPFKSCGIVDRILCNLTNSFKTISATVIDVEEVNNKYVFSRDANHYSLYQLVAILNTIKFSHKEKREKIVYEEVEVFDN